MKKISVLLLGVILFVLPVQLRAELQVGNSLSDVLNLYYAVKDALIKSNAAEASVQAGLLLKAINNIDMTTLTNKEHEVFMSLINKLSLDARHISEVQKIEHQREHFASLSLNMYTLVKSANTGRQVIYEDYCPMKKAYWLSSEAEIKNPYYGSQMPDCGEIKQKLP